MKEWIAAAQGTAVTLGGALSLGWIAVAAARARLRRNSVLTVAAALGLPLFALIAAFVEKKGVLTGVSVALLAASLALRGRTTAGIDQRRGVWLDLAALAALASAQYGLTDALSGAAFLAGGVHAAAVTRVGVRLLVALAVRSVLAQWYPPNVGWAAALITLLLPLPFAPLTALAVAMVVGRHPGFVWLPVAFAAATANWTPPSPSAESLLIEARTPKRSVVYCDVSVEKGWTTRRLVTGPAPGQILRRAYETRADRVEVRPGFRAARHELETNGAAEIRFYARGAEIEREPAWRVLCPDAFDNSLLTACTGKAGVTFGREVTVDEVRVFGMRGTASPVPPGLRRAATAELKRRGITHVLAGPEGSLADELSRNAEYWGVEEIAESNGTRIYRIR